MGRTMTKREVLITLANRQDQLIKEIRAVGEITSLSSSDQLGNAVAIGMIVSSRLREIAQRPEMTRDITLVEKV